MSIDEVRQAMRINREADQLREIARLEAENASLLEANRALAADLERWSDQGKRLEAEVARLHQAIKQAKTIASVVGLTGHFGQALDEIHTLLHNALAPDSGVVKIRAENGAETQIGPSADVEVDQC